MRPWDIFGKFSKLLEYLSSNKLLGDSGFSYIYLLLRKIPTPIIYFSVVKIHVATITTLLFLVS